MDLASTLGVDVSQVGSLERWVEEAEDSGWHVFFDDDEDCEENESDSTESQQVTGKSAEVTSGNKLGRSYVVRIAFIKFKNIFRMLEHL